MFVEVSDYLFKFVYAILKVESALFEFSELRDTARVEVFEVGVFSEALEVFPDPLPIIDR